MSALWGQRDFRRLLVGQWLSALGDWTATVALVALALELSGSAAAVSGVLVLRLAPGVVAGPLAARVAGRWDRRRTMLAMDAVRAVLACAGRAWMIGSDPAPRSRRRASAAMARAASRLSHAPQVSLG